LIYERVSRCRSISSWTAPDEPWRFFYIRTVSGKLISISLQLSRLRVAAEQNTAEADLKDAENGLAGLETSHDLGALQKDADGLKAALRALEATTADLASQVCTKVVIICILWHLHHVE
jgi:hypothetical protein